MVAQLAAATTSFVIAFLVVPIIIKYSLLKNLVDVPGRRKIHKKITPSMGGIAIFCGFFIASFIWINLHHWAAIKFIMVALFSIFIIGVRDDLIPLRWSFKLIGQVLAASLLIFLLDLRITSFYGLFGIYELHPLVSYVITYFTIIVVTNSFNLIDGLDGLAGTIAIISLMAFGVWFYLIGDPIFSVLAFAMLGAILAFLIFNWEPSEIFMGDTGALVIGMTLAIMAIKFLETNDTLASGTYQFIGPIGTVICVIIIPLVDTLRIFILRISKRQSPFKPDKSHIHHALMRLGLTHSQTTLLLGGVQVLIITLAVVFHEYSERYILSGVILLSYGCSIVLDRLILKRLSAKDTVESKESLEEQRP
jgi:UDP-GlcNAc:undecaprenyl-phosphate/decaprenyl-phosphate GlcNAc-1-phosphate transferase